MAHHRLNGDKVGTTFQQSRGERVAQRVRTNGFSDARCHRLTLYHDKNHGASKVRTAPIKKHIILFARLNAHCITVGKPCVQLVKRAARYGNQSLLVALSRYAHKLLFHIKVRKFQVNKLRHPQSATEQHLNNGPVALSFPFGKVDRGLQAVNLGRTQHVGQGIAHVWRHQQLRWVGINKTIEK